MALETEQPVNQRIIALFLKNGHGEDVSLGFAHLALSVVEMLNVEPMCTPSMAQCCFTLRYLIGMMRKDIVHASAVQIAVFSEMLQADCRALDMPAGVSDAPGTVPLELL